MAEERRLKGANDNHPNLKTISLGRGFSKLVSRTIPKAKEIATYGGDLKEKEEDEFAEAVTPDIRKVDSKMEEKVKKESHPNISKTSFAGAPHRIESPLKKMEAHPNIDKVSVANPSGGALGGTTKQLRDMGVEQKVMGKTVDQVSKDVKDTYLDK